MVFLMMEDCLNNFLKVCALFQLKASIVLCSVLLLYIETEHRNLRMFVENLSLQVLLIEIVYK